MRGTPSRGLPPAVRRARQHLPDADELLDMGQQPLDHRDPGRPPALRVDGIVQAPADVGAGQPGELDVQAVLHPGPAQDLVVGPGGLQLLGRVQVGDVHQVPGRQVPEARHPFVDGMVGGEVLALQVVAALPPIVEPDEKRPDVVRRAFTDHEAITGQAAGLIDQGRGGRPATGSRRLSRRGRGRSAALLHE